MTPYQYHTHKLRLASWFMADLPKPGLDRAYPISPNEQRGIDAWWLFFQFSTTEQHNAETNK